MRKFELFLGGKLVKLSKVMYGDMWKASEAQEYEHASKIRNEIRSLEATALKQRIAFPNQKDRDKDVVTIARKIEEAVDDKSEINRTAAAIVFQVRQGNVIGREKYILDIVNEKATDSEIISAFIKQHYSSTEALVGHQFPHEIVVPSELIDSTEIEELTSTRGSAWGRKREHHCQARLSTIQ